MVTKIEQFKESFNFSIERPKPKGWSELKDLITGTIELYGNECDLNFIDTSLITNMAYLFFQLDTKNFNGDISEWNTSNVTTMEGMFMDSNFEGNIDNWEVRNDCIIKHMFNSSKLKRMNKLPVWVKQTTNESFNFNIERPKPKSLTELYNLVKDTMQIYGNECDLNFIDTSLIINMAYLFFQLDTRNFNGDISGWDVSNVTNMEGMFIDSNFEGNIDNWKVRNGTDMKWTFSKSKLEKQNKLPSWYN